MAEHNYHRAGLQHLAHLQQDSVHRLGASALQWAEHRHPVSEQYLQQAALEAYLQRQLVSPQQENQCQLNQNNLKSNS
jgi:hypothetical protein